MARRVAGIAVKLQAQVVVPTTGAVAAVGDRVGVRQNVGDNGDNHNPFKEVIHRNNDYRELIIMGSLPSRAGWSNR